MSSHYRKSLRVNFFFLWLLSMCLCATCIAAETVQNANVIRIIDLPKQSIGTIYTSKVDSDLCGLSEMQPIGSAAGRVKVAVPRNTFLFLAPNRRMLESREDIGAFPATAFDGLKLEFMSMEDGEGSTSDAILHRVNNVSHLKFLILNKSDASDNGILGLKQMPYLQQLSASQSGLTGAFLRQSQNFPQLLVLSLFNCQINSTHLIGLSKLSKLIYLDIHHTNLNEIGMRYIGQCRSLKVLRASENPQLDDRCIACLINLKNLRRIDLEQTLVTAAGLKCLKALPHLRSIRLSAESFSKNDIQMLRLLFPQTEIECTHRSADLDQIDKVLYAPLH